jgi:hypothetical protein
MYRAVLCYAVPCYAVLYRPEELPVAGAGNQPATPEPGGAAALAEPLRTGIARDGCDEVRADRGDVLDVLCCASLSCLVYDTDTSSSIISHLCFSLCATDEQKACFPLLQRHLSLQLELLPPATASPSQAIALSTQKSAPVHVHEQETSDSNASTPNKTRLTPADNATSFASRMPSMFNMGFSTNPLFSPTSRLGNPLDNKQSSPIRKKSNNPQKLYSPVSKTATELPPFRNTTSEATIARAANAAVTYHPSAPQDPAKLTKNMTFIINIHTQYARLVPAQEEKEVEEATAAGGIDSVPSHPLYSADITAVRKKFRTDIQHMCTVQYRKNFTAYLKSLPAFMEENAITKDMALLCLNMIDAHETTDMSGMRSPESWNNARTKSIVMLLELLWSKKVDQGFFCHTLTSSSNRHKIKHQVLVTLQILTASCEFAASHYGMTDRLVVHLFIPFIESLPNAIATMSLPSYGYSSLDQDDGVSGGTSDDKMDTGVNNTEEKEDRVSDKIKEEAGERQFMHDTRRDMHSSSSSFPSNVVDMTSDDAEDPSPVQQFTKSESKQQQEPLDDRRDKPAIVLVHIERCVLTLILGREEGGGEESSEAALKLIRRYNHHDNIYVLFIANRA